MTRPARYLTVGQAARRTGLTVRALHHYEAEGLIAPARHPANGYRIYEAEDLARLERVLILRMLGLPLKDIRRLMTADGAALGELVARQRVRLERQLGEARGALDLVAAAERFLQRMAGSDVDTLCSLIKETEMTAKKNPYGEVVAKYMDPEDIERIAARRTPEEVVRKGEADWAKLIDDAQALMGRDPASPEVQALADRWAALVEGFVQGDAKLEGNLRRMYADMANWPGGATPPFSPELYGWMGKALAIRKARRDKPD